MPRASSSAGRVHEGGRVEFRGRRFRVGKAFTGYPVGRRPTAQDGRFDVLFCHQPIATIDLSTSP